MNEEILLEVSKRRLEMIERELDNLCYLWSNVNPQADEFYELSQIWKQVQVLYSYLNNEDGE